jgi:tetratricopeptide (TPR) repeat protein
MRHILLGLMVLATLLPAARAEEAALTPEQQAKMTRAGELNILLMQHYQAGRYQEALAPARESMAIRREVLGPTHPDYAVSLNNLAAILETLGRYDESLPLHREALAIYEEDPGKKSGPYATSLNTLAKATVSIGQYPEGAALYREAAAINAQLYGEGSDD